MPPKSWKHNLMKRNSMFYFAERQKPQRAKLKHMEHNFLKRNGERQKPQRAMPIKAGNTTL